MHLHNIPNVCDTEEPVLPVLQQDHRHGQAVQTVQGPAQLADCPRESPVERRPPHG